MYSLMSSFGGRYQTLVLALVLLSTVGQLADSNPTQSRAAANIVNNVPTVQNKIYNKMVNPTMSKYIGGVQSPNFYGQSTQNSHHNNMQPLPPPSLPQQQVLIPSAEPVVVQEPQPQMATSAQIQSAQVDDLLKQVHALKGQLPAAAAPTVRVPTHINNHVSKVSIGNTKETNINNISNSVAPITSKSVTSQDVGPKSSHLGNQNTAYNGSPVTTMNGDGDLTMGAPMKKVKTHPTEEQKELKARLLELASKATASSPSEPILKYNQRTGTLERVPVDPNANLYKDKLHQALEMLNPKKLPTNKLRKVLNDEQSSPLNPYEQVVIPRAPVYVAPEAAPEQPVYVEEIPEAEFAAAAAPQHELAPPTREDIVNQIRFDLDDRLNRISDLLYFRPEFMNQLLQIDDPSELTPVESEFKRMILCNSDEQFCLQDLANWSAGSSPPAIGHVQEFSGAPEEAVPAMDDPMEEFVAESQPEPSYYSQPSYHSRGSEPSYHSQHSLPASPSHSRHSSPSYHSHQDEYDGEHDDLMDDASSSAPVFSRLRSSSSSQSHHASSPIEGARGASRPKKRAPSGKYAEPQQPQQQQQANSGSSRYPSSSSPSYATSNGQARAHPQQSANGNANQMTRNPPATRSGYRQPARVQPVQWQQQQQQG